ncbi:MAG: hypothetical protein JW795_02915, partial [Chitinivibrionales bacterium]|nr:hypothetical protein [Chitinivibrionales bacterium]
TVLVVKPEEKSEDVQSAKMNEEKAVMLTGKIDGLQESYLETKSTVDKLSKIKMSGYVQAQVRYTDTMLLNTNASGATAYQIGSFQGGAFPANTKTVVQVRRARLKVSYQTPLTEATVQLDMLPAGVSIKDAYCRFVEPFIKSVAFKAGVMARPFGFEGMYSSGSREMPESSRLIQTVFPQDYDLGVALEYLPVDNLSQAARIFTVMTGIFNGNGIGDENDNYKDIIGRLGVTLPLTSINLAVDGGFSGYYGKVNSTADTAYKTVNKRMVAYVGNLQKEFDRQYLGADIQMYYDIAGLGGISLRGEFITGKHPGTKSSSSIYKPYNNVARRKIRGYYASVVQNIGPKFQLVGRYDVFDPNTDVIGDEIRNNAGFTAADIKYQTTGFGILYHYDENIKFTLYYDNIRNEEVNSDLSSNATMKIFTKDLKDDVVTFRMQYKF